MSGIVCSIVCGSFFRTIFALPFVVINKTLFDKNYSAKTLPIRAKTFNLWPNVAGLCFRFSPPLLKFMIAGNIRCEWKIQKTHFFQFQTAEKRRKFDQRQRAAQDCRDGGGQSRQKLADNAVPVQYVLAQVQAHRRGDAPRALFGGRGQPDAGHPGHVRVVRGKFEGYFQCHCSGLKPSRMMGTENCIRRKLSFFNI